MKILLGVVIGLATTMVQAFPQGVLNDVPTEITTDILTKITTEKTKGEDEKGAMEKCNDVMANNGLNFSSFWHGAAHGIHSLGLEEIHHFFEHEAPEQNRIPVVNVNLSSEQTILFHAPLRGYDEDFNTMALKVMAFFMLNDKPYFYQQGTNTLEKVTHQYHMHEIYAAAGPIYRKIKKDPPMDPELCPCVNDVTANGILTEMVNIAKKLKYFSRQPRARQDWSVTLEYDSASSGAVSRPQIPQRPQSGVINTAITYGISKGISRGKRNVENSSEIIAQLEDEYLADSSHENARKLMNVNPWHANTLLGPGQWKSYEAMLTWSMLEEEELNDFAVFMYCKLNQPDLDHARDLFE